MAYSSYYCPLDYITLYSLCRGINMKGSAVPTIGYAVGPGRFSVSFMMRNLLGSRDDRNRKVAMMITDSNNKVVASIVCGNRRLCNAASL